MQLNVQSISNKLENLEILFEEKNPDVISVVEHWCNKDSIGAMVIPGYIQADCFCRSYREHGGSMLLCKAGLKFKNLLLSEFSEEMHIEICGIEVSFRNARLGILSIYRPCNGDIDLFFDKLHYALQACFNVVDFIFLCGDFNIDYFRQDCKNKKLTDLLLCFGLGVTSTVATRVFTNINGNTSVSKVDYVITNTHLKNYKSAVFEAHISDHRAIFLHLSSGFLKKQTPEFRWVRNISPSNLSDLVSCISAECFDELYLEPNVDLCFQSFINIMQFHLERCCPLMRQYSGNSRKKWVTTEIKSSKRNLNNLYWLYRNISSPDTLEMYRRAKKQHNKLIQKTKLSFHCSMIEKSDNKAKTVWSLVDTLTTRGIKNSNPICININGIKHDDPIELVDIFGRYFSSVARSKLNSCYAGDLSVSCTTSPLLCNNFFFYPVSKHEVLETIKKLKNKKSTGVDCISVQILKSVADVVCEHFAHLINLSISTGKFPKILKKSIVVPIYKKGDVNEITNYRPISLLSVFSKVFEKIVLTRIMDYLDKFKLLNSAQHGFRTGRSTQTAALSFVESVYECLDSNFCVAGLFFDLSCAFDTLSFQFILDKCYSLGFRGIFLEWLRSFLDERTMSVRVNDHFSEEYGVDLGVPQGSVLGPLMFLLFINDLPHHLTCLLLTLFADDTSVVISARSCGELQVACETLVTQFVNWCHPNRLMLNVDKTVCVYFGLKNFERGNLRIRYVEDIIVPSECTKFLGVYIDRNLSWTTHVDYLCKKLNTIFFAILRVKNVLPVGSLLDIYYSLVYCHLTYNIILWGSCVDISRIFIAQKRIIRKIFNLSSRTSCRPVFNANRLLPLPCIYILKCLVYAKENERNWTRLSSNHEYKTRNSQILLVPKHRTHKFECSPLYQSIKLFNHLPSSVKSLDLRKFKLEVKEILLKKCYYSVGEYCVDILS